MNPYQHRPVWESELWLALVRAPQDELEWLHQAASEKNSLAVHFAILGMCIRIPTNYYKEIKQHLNCMSHRMYDDFCETVVDLIDDVGKPLWRVE